VESTNKKETLTLSKTKKQLKSGCNFMGLCQERPHLIEVELEELEAGRFY